MVTRFVDGDRYESGNLRLIKGCRCQGTSSGPRLVMQAGREDGRSFVRARWSALVCDVCRKPWGGIPAHKASS